ncbi:MAG: carboxy terminal-processing peptidase [Ferruginibacter sp.]
MRSLVLFVLMISSVIAIAQQNNPGQLRQKSQVLRRFLEQNHYLPLQWNDASSQLLYNRWMETIDDDKLIFTQTDIAQLQPFNTKLDEEMMGKEWKFYDKCIQLYGAGLTRVQKNIADILAKPLDYSKADSLNWPLKNYSANETENLQLWRQYLKWKVLHVITDKVLDSVSGKAINTRQPANFLSLETSAREQVKKQELISIENRIAELASPGKDMEDDYLEAITWCYDPHTEYMNADKKTDFDTEMSGLEFSTGFEMDENDKDEWEITYLVPGGPAWRNGDLHKGDVILKIKAGDKQALVLADATMQQMNEVFAGSSSEKITITVRTQSGIQKTAILAKEKVANEDGLVKSFLLKGDKKIGYITLPGFYVKEGDEDNTNGCSNDVAKEIVKLKKDSIAGLILDLRYNGGGSLGEALELAGIFINEGTITSTKDPTGKVHFLKDPNRGTIYDGPLLVMVNTMSASASELVSAVLQDYHRALIVGSTTYGKGTAQIILPMDTSGKFSKTEQYESYVKVTDAKFYRVDGTTTQWKGVVPDIELPDIYALDKYREKFNASALQPDQSKVAIYHALSAIPVEALKEASNKRVNADKNFKIIADFAAWYKAMDEPRTIPLQWTSYTDYYQKITDMYANIEAEKELSKKVFKATNNSLDRQRESWLTLQSKSVNEINIKRIEKDDYINESFKIMEDWLK